MKLLSAVLALAVSATAVAATERTDQWLYREVEGGGMANQPTAVFLDYAYTGVVLQAQCDREAGDLVIDYFGDGVAKLAEGDELELIIGDDFLPLPTVLADNRLQGRIAAQTVLNAWGEGDQLAVSGPTERGDPWAAGAAEPFKTVAADCTAITP